MPGNDIVVDSSQFRRGTEGSSGVYHRRTTKEWKRDVRVRRRKKEAKRKKQRPVSIFFTSLTDFSIQIHLKKDEESLIKNYSQRLLIGHLK